MEMGTPLNRRKDDRYFIDEIPVEGNGSIVEVSKNGLKIRKAPGFSVETPAVTLQISNMEIKAEVRWADKNMLGLQSTNAFSNPALLNQRVKTIREAVAPPQMKVFLDKAIKQYKRDEALIAMIDLLMEVDDLEPDIGKIATYVREISSLQENENMAAVKDESEAEGKDGVKTCGEEIIARFIDLRGRDDNEEIDINFAISVLGLAIIREIIRDQVHKRFFLSAGAGLSSRRDSATLSTGDTCR